MLTHIQNVVDNLFIPSFAANNSVGSNYEMNRVRDNLIQAMKKRSMELQRERGTMNKRRGNSIRRNIIIGRGLPLKSTDEKFVQFGKLVLNLPN